MGGILHAVGDNGNEDRVVFLNFFLQCIDAESHGIEEGRAAVGMVVLGGHVFGLRGRNAVVDSLGPSAVEHYEGDVVLLLRMLLLRRADGLYGLVETVDGLGLDEIHGPGRIEDDEVVDLLHGGVLLSLEYVLCFIIACTKAQSIHTIQYMR